MDKWRLEEAERLTKEKRPDMYRKYIRAKQKAEEKEREEKRRQKAARRAAKLAGYDDER